jgi:hypothetical protein
MDLDWSKLQGVGKIVPSSDAVVCRQQRQMRETVLELKITVESSDRRSGKPEDRKKVGEQNWWQF